MKKRAVIAGALLLMPFSIVYAQDMPPGYGYNPPLPEPHSSLIPTVNVAKASGWPEGVNPLPAAGFTVQEFADGLAHPRWIYVLPNGDVLVAETDKPAKKSSGLKGTVMKMVQKRAGSGEGSADRITLLRDTNNDGIVDIKSPFLENLYSPFGMALIGNYLYVANTDAILRFPYKRGDTRIEADGMKVTDLPANAPNSHWTKNIVASPDGKYLYASVGSNSNVADGGIEKEENRAAILQVDLKTGTSRVYAYGLRNPVGMDWNPQSGKLWTAVNERDELGDDLVPDYMTSVQDGGFYGWPYSYFGQHVDERVEPPRPDLVAKAIMPDYALGAHTASLGLAFNKGNAWPRKYHGGAFIGQHGSWNKKVQSGYRVIFVPFRNGKPAGPPEDILTEFLNVEDNKAYGRPVGVAFDKKGGLLVADDVGDNIWRVSPQK